MAFAVTPGTQTALAAGASTVLTKPVGLQVGDLMIALVSAFSGIGIVIDTKTDWTLVQTRSLTGGSISIQTKIADAGDVAASNFTFACTSASNMAGVILRAAGHASTFLDTSDLDVNNVAASAIISFTTTVSPAQDGSLVVMLFGAGDGAEGSMSTYVTSDGALSFSECLDTSINSGSQDPIAGGAYGIQTTKAALTTYGATISTSKDDHGGIIAVFTPSISAEGTAALLQGSPTFFAPTAQAGTTGTVDLLQGTPTFFAPVGSEDSPTDKWSHPAVPESEWITESLP